MGERKPRRNLHNVFICVYCRATTTNESVYKLFFYRYILRVNCENGRTLRWSHDRNNNRQSTCATTPLTHMLNRTQPTYMFCFGNFSRFFSHLILFFHFLRLVFFYFSASISRLMYNIYRLMQIVCSLAHAVSFYSEIRLTPSKEKHLSLCLWIFNWNYMFVCCYFGSFRSSFFYTKFFPQNILMVYSRFPIYNVIG